MATIDPTPYPWVKFMLSPTKSIDSTPLPVFISPQHCIIDSIFVCNTTDQDIYIDIDVEASRGLETGTYAFKRREFIPKLGKAQFVPSVLHMQTGDVLYANSDFSGNTFDIEVSYRELTELSSVTAVEPFSYPWVNFLMSPAKSIDSTPTFVFGSVYDCVIDSIFVCNTTDQDIYIDAYILAERNLVAENNYIAKKLLLTKNASDDLVKLSSLQMQAGDIFYINSDFSGNTFDCLVSYREIREEAP